MKNFFFTSVPPVHNRKVNRFLLGLFFWLHATALCLPQETCLDVSEAPDWDQLLKNEQGWLGADGIYSVYLPISKTFDDSERKRVVSPRNPEFNENEKLNETPQILLLFSDTIIGTTKNEGQKFDRIQIANHSMALLTGKEPKKDRIRFLFPSECKRPEQNLLGYRCWLQQGMVADHNLTLTTLVFNPKTWKPDRVDALRLPLTPQGVPLFQPERTPSESARVSSAPSLTSISPKGQIVWGAALLDVSDKNLIYIFGYVDNYQESSRKDLIAAKAPKTDWLNQKAWQYYDGRNWRDDPAVAWNTEAGLAKGISPEFSISPIPAGPCSGKYLLVYTPGGISPDLAYRVGDSPVGPFGKPVCFYHSNVPQTLGKGIFCYNGKGHPILSRSDALLVSYNVNRLGAIARRPDEYRPRFVWLPYDSLAAPAF